MKSTEDDWYGNFENNTVKLTYHPQLADGKYRVSIWGNDDFGIDKDFDSPAEAEEVFCKLKIKKVINKNDLYALGFENF
jgi:hypothetical protein